MTNEAVKLELINWLTKLNDETVIQSLKIVKDSIESTEESDTYLTDKLNQAASDIDSGRVSDHDDIADEYGL